MTHKKKGKLEKINWLMLKAFSLITIFSFVGFISFLGFMFLVLPKQETSEIERRSLTKKPDFSLENLFSGTYTDDYSLYYSDNFSFREKFVEMSFLLEEKRGLRLGSVKIYNSGVTSKDVSIEASSDIISKDSFFCSFSFSHSHTPCPLYYRRNIFQSMRRWCNFIFTQSLH